MNVKNGASASIRQSALQSSQIPNGRLSIMELETMGNNELLNRLNVNPKYATNSEMNEINSLLSVSRLSQNNNDKSMIIDTNEMKNSAKSFMKFQSNFNILNDMFNNMKTDTNNNDKNAMDKNLHQQGENNVLPPLNSPPKKIDEPERPNEQEKINDVFINLLKDQKEPLDYNAPTYNSNNSFYLHDPKPSAQRQRQRNDSGMSFKMLSKGARDNSFDEGFFDSLNGGKKNNKASAKDNIVKNWDNNDGMEDDELASILG